MFNGIEQHLLSVCFIIMGCSLFTHNVGCVFVLGVDKDENSGCLGIMY